MVIPLKGKKIIGKDGKRRENETKKKKEQKRQLKTSLDGGPLYKKEINQMG